MDITGYSENVHGVKVMKIFLATWTEDNQGETLSKVDYKNRLMSYFFLRDVKDDDFVLEYVFRGKVRRKNENKD